MITYVIIMTLFNVKIDKKKKEYIKDLIKESEYKSVSDFVRKVIDEKIKVLESRKYTDEIEVPDWIPDGKYYAIIKGSIVGVDDTVSSLAKEIVAKFPFEQITVKRKNKEFPKREYVYSTLSTNLKL